MRYRHYYSSLEWHLPSTSADCDTCLTYLSHRWDIAHTGPSPSLSFVLVLQWTSVHSGSFETPLLSIPDSLWNLYWAKQKVCFTKNKGLDIITVCKDVSCESKLRDTSHMQAFMVLTLLSHGFLIYNVLQVQTEQVKHYSS